MLNNYKIGDTIYIGNTGPYIMQLENNYSLTTNGEKLDVIKKPYTLKQEDGSTLIEWIFAKFRIGFSFWPV